MGAHLRFPPGLLPKVHEIGELSINSKFMLTSATMKFIQFCRSQKIAKGLSLAVGRGHTIHILSLQKEISEGLKKVHIS